MPKQQDNNTNRKAARRGVTLIEIAIVLVIIGILLGGILKGQELINNARVRALANQQISLRVAWFSFIAKFQAKPGDYIFAQQNIRGAAPIGAQSYFPGDGIVSLLESPIAFQNLSGAGFIDCQRCSASETGPPTTENTPQNRYGGLMAIYTNNVLVIAAGKAVEVETTYAHRGTAAGTHRFLVHSGGKIPSNIMTQIDLKFDDGIANTGDLVFNSFDGGDPARGAPDSACMSKSREKQERPAAIFSPDLLFWRHASENPLPNCGFSLFL